MTTRPKPAPRRAPSIWPFMLGILAVIGVLLYAQHLRNRCAEACHPYAGEARDAGCYCDKNKKVTETP